MSTGREQDSIPAFTKLCGEFKKNNQIPPQLYEKFQVKRGLRNSDGSGVMAGLTLICNVHGYIIDDGELIPHEGKLYYRGIEVSEIVENCLQEGRFGFEETIWLLLFGTLPCETDLSAFRDLISVWRELPDYFAEDMIIKAPSPNIMNKLARSVLALYSYDDNPDDTRMENVMRQSISLIAQLPTIMCFAYQVKRRHYDNQSMFLHPMTKGHSTAEFILSSIRADRSFTKEEAQILDMCLILHAEHGGGNNSTFTSRVLSSSGTDTYSAIAGAIGSLKGPRHGGANIKVMKQLEAVKSSVSNYADDEEILAFLKKVIRHEEGDGSGLIYGMGHAVYTLSDPRAIILKRNAKKLAEERGLAEDFALLEAIERLTPEAFRQVKGVEKKMCANVDLYSGLVYKTLGISEDLFTPLFAVSRVAGWCAHRIEEITSGGKIIRPAYKAVLKNRSYLPLKER